MPSSRIAALVDEWQAHGRYTFTRSDVAAALDGHWRTTELDALRRLAAVHRIVRPYRGFYVIVPLEYRTAGAPPPSWFIHGLMAFLAQPYYVGLLSAAALYGATHQAIQPFQVITDRPIRLMRAGRAELRFIQHRTMACTPTLELPTETGTMRVSTPEATVFDLVRFREQAGELNHIATMLEELTPGLDTSALQALAMDEPTALVRRIGYLLDQVGARAIADPLAIIAESRRVQPEQLHPSMPRQGAVRDPR